jgi:membrane protein DedA with SNARE-associated domain
MSDWVIRLIDWGGYAGVFLLMLLETVFPPIPSEVIMPVAGLRAANGPMSLGGVILAGTAGAMVGNLFWYFVARAVGRRRFRRFIERHGRWLSMDCYDVDRVQALFGRFGGWLVSIGRMTPTIRTFVSVPAGLMHMNLGSFFLWSTVGTAGWSALLALAGYLLGLRFERIEEVIGPVSTIVVGAIVAVYVWRQLTWHRRHKPGETPACD